MRSEVPLLTLAAAALASCAPAPEPRLEAQTVCAMGPTVRGIDVSKYQAAIDWSKVAGAGISFAFIRVSDGINNPDAYFASNWANAKAAGLVRGVYQYFRPSADPVVQANLLLTKMGPLGPDDLPPVIDVESTDGLEASSVVTKIAKWLDVVEHAIGRKAIVYTGKYFWQDKVASMAFSDRPLWIAQYNRTCPDLPVQWSDWHFFQNSDAGKVAGIAGGVDTNLFNGDTQALLLFAHGGPRCGDALCSEQEDAQGCPADCSGCTALPPEGGVVDEASPCFRALGPGPFGREEAGWQGGSRWVATIEAGAAPASGVWQLGFMLGGRYQVEVHVAGPQAVSPGARYELVHGGEATSVTVSQEGAAGWRSLGEHEFSSGGGQELRLANDAPGGAVVFDAVRLTRVARIQAPTEVVEGGEDPEAAPPPAAGGCGLAGGARSASALGPLGLLLLAAALRRRARA